MRTEALELIPYASRTGTRRNLAELRRANWRLLVSAAGRLRAEGFRYALDNGAWSAYTQGKPFDEKAFARALKKMGAKADWTVIPDIVAGGLASLEMSVRWMRPVLDECPRALLAVQDGMSMSDVEPFVGARVGIFVGGSTEWKLRTLHDWGAFGRKNKCWVHVGRVNSKKRISSCATAGVTSFDGTSVTRFARSLPWLDEQVRQLTLGGLS